jgi:hypothetical protein
LLEPELPEADLPELAELPCWVDVACADPGRLYATPAAVSTLARPAVAVIVRSRIRWRSLAAIRCVRPPSRVRPESGVIWCLPPAAGEFGADEFGADEFGADDSSLASFLLHSLCAR